jgi:cytidylate kinase
MSLPSLIRELFTSPIKRREKARRQTAAAKRAAAKLTLQDAIRRRDDRDQGRALAALKAATNDELRGR